MVEEILLYFDYNGETKSVSIIDGANNVELVTGVPIKASDGSNDLKLPSKNGGERTYIAQNLISKKIKVAAVVEGKSCEISDETVLNPCND